MKPSFLPFSAVASAMLILASCEAFLPERPQGRIFLQFSEDYYLTRSAYDLPDTNDFLLSILDSKGVELYNGKYGDSPVSLSLDPGSYTVSAVSSEFKSPEFSAPQFGDRQVVVVSSGTDVYVNLVCRQLNAGVKLNISPDFLTSYPQGSLFIKGEGGKLMYGYREKRIAYFNPGRISLVLSDGGTDATLLTRLVESQEILVLNVSASASPMHSGSGITVSVDTSRLWKVEDFVIGGEDDGGAGVETAYSVTEARSHPDEEDVWVGGYVVGGDLSSSSASFSSPFKSRTNIVLGARSSVKDRAYCLSVQLQKGDIRDALNLVDNPDILGKYVYLRGDLVEAYYGIPGIRNVTEYVLKDD